MKMKIPVAIIVFVTMLFEFLMSICLFIVQDYIMSIVLFTISGILFWILIILIKKLINESRRED
jgi:hypothetical protein